MSGPLSDGNSFIDDSSRLSLLSRASSTSSRYLVVPSNRRKLAWAGAVTAAIIVVVTAGLATAFLLWMITRRFDRWQEYGPGMVGNLPKNSFIVNEGVRRGHDDLTQSTAALHALTISALSSQIISVANSFTMGLVAYRAAAQWLGRSTSSAGRHNDNNPTPLQYGLLLGLLNSCSNMSIFRALSYTWRNKTSRSPLPRLFIEALACSIVLLTLTHAIGAGDLWLHTTADSILIPVSTTLPQDPSFNHGVSFDQHLCDGLAVEGYPCLHDIGGGWANVSNTVRSAGFLTAYNFSTAAFRPITLNANNDTAIIVPNTISSISSNASPGLSAYAYQFETFGARANCTLLNSLCANDGRTVLNCTQAGYKWLPSIVNSTTAIPKARIFTVRNDDIGTFNGGVYQEFPANTPATNPSTALVQLDFSLQDVINIKDSPLIDGWGALYAACDLVYLNVSIKYNPLNDSYTMVESETAASSPELAEVLWEPILSQYANDRLTAGLQGAVLMDFGGLQNVTALLNQEFGRLAISWAAGIFLPAPAHTSSLISYMSLGSYPMAPVIFFVSMLYTYALFTLSIFFSSRNFTSYGLVVLDSGHQEKTGVRVVGRTESVAISLAQKWLTNPIPFVAAILGDSGEDVKRSVAERSLDMIDDVDADRLVLGLHPNKHGDISFGLKKRSTRHDDGEMMLVERVKDEMP